MIEEVSPSKSAAAEGGPLGSFQPCVGSVFFEDFQVRTQLHDVASFLKFSFLKKKQQNLKDPFGCFQAAEYCFSEKVLLSIQVVCRLFIFARYYRTFNYFVLIRGTEDAAQPGLLPRSGKLGWDFPASLSVGSDSEVR